MLIDKFPSSIRIDDGFSVEINTDFRNFIRFESIMFGNNSLSKKEKVLKVFNLFSDFVPQTSAEISAYMDGIIDIYRCGKEIKKLNPVIESKQKQLRMPKIFDFTFDSPYIFAAFIEAYSIDLTQVNMHWYKFKALFDALPSDCQFSKILGYRGTDITKIKDSDEKQRIIKLQTIYALPKSLTEHDKIAEAGRIFNGEYI